MATKKKKAATRDRTPRPPAERGPGEPPAAARPASEAPPTSSAGRPVPSARSAAPTGLFPLPEASSGPRTVALLAAVAWAFGFVVRLLWLPGAEANPQAVFGDHVTLTVTDGYYWGASVLEALGHIDADILRLPAWHHHAVPFLGTVFGHVFPPQEVMLYLPAVVAPLIAVPLVLLGNLVGSPRLGFGAALLAVVGWSYYNRTLMGYFDTDMFSVTVPLVLLWLLAAAVVHRSPARALAAALFMVAGPFFYDQIGLVLFAFAATFGAYVVLFCRRDDFAWPALAMVALAVMPLPWFVRAGLIVALHLIVARGLVTPRHVMWATLALGAVFLATSPLVRAVIHQVGQYAARGVVEAQAPGDVGTVRVTGLIREMVRLPLPDLAARYAGSVAGLVLGGAGYLLLCWRYRPLLLALPFVALGGFALWGGLRFTIYAVPVAALGLAFLASVVVGQLAARAPRYRAVLAWVLTPLALAPLLVPQVDDALSRPPATTVLAGEAELMSRLGDLAQPGDYALAWWDFGYPLWYFGRVGALIDGGKHGRDNLVVSLALTTDSQLQAANLARTAIERYHARRWPSAPVLPRLFAEARERGLTQREALAELAAPAYAPPDKTREVYLYLPHKMLTLLGAVEQFSRSARRPEGAADRAPVSLYSPVKQEGRTLLLRRGGHRLDLDARTLTDGEGRPVPLRGMHLVEMNAEGQVRSQTQPGDPNARVHAILLRSYGAVMLLDDELFRSVLVQLYLFERFDPALFEKVTRTAFGVIYKLLR